MSFTPLDYIANALYQADSRDRGHEAGVRWWCLRDDLKLYWHTRAEEVVSSWAAKEERTLTEMQRIYGEPPGASPAQEPKHE